MTDFCHDQQKARAPRNAIYELFNLTICRSLKKTLMKKLLGGGEIEDFENIDLYISLKSK